MRRFAFAILFSFLLLALAFTQRLNPQILVTQVGASTEHDVYPGESIQEAINLAQHGDTIFVHAGIYYEHVVVNKSLALIGEDRETTIIDGNGTYEKVVLVEADSVTVKGFTVQRGFHGIDLSGDFNTVENNTITDNSYGILFSHAKHNNVTGCEVTYNDLGILIYVSDENIVTRNRVAGNNHGIRLEYSQNNTLSLNNMTSNRFNFGIHGETPSDYINSIDASNTVNNKPIYYLTEQRHIVINSSTLSNVGYLALINSTDVQVEGLTLTNNYQGLLLAYTNDSVIKNLDILNNYYGVILIYSNSNVITKNTVANNSYSGTSVVWDSTDNSIFHNNFENNTNQAYGTQFANAWDNGYPSGGNCWSDYDGADSNNDGVVDSEYNIDYYNTDHFPLMGTFSSFDASLGYNVNVVSNSTIDSFEYSELNNKIKMYVSNTTVDQDYGFCRVCIPKDLIAPEYHVEINDGAVEVLYFNNTIYDNNTHRWIYFAYEHSTHEIIIVPEFPSFLILPLFMIVTLLAVIVYRRKHTSNPLTKEKLG